jgi:YD repeat-containing protein
MDGWMDGCGRGQFRPEWSVAGTAAAWQNVDVSLSGGGVVPDRKLCLPPQSEGYSHYLNGIMTNRFLYADLTSPIQLAANTAYYLVSLETNGGDKWCHNDTVVTSGPGMTVTHAAHGSGGNYWTSAGANNGYGPVSLVGAVTSESRTQLRGLDLSGSEQGAGGVSGLLGTRTGSGATRLMAYDGNGNVVRIVDGSSGKTAAAMLHSPFGELIEQGGNAERDRYGFSTNWGEWECRNQLLWIPVPFCESRGMVNRRSRKHE